MEGQDAVQVVDRLSLQGQPFETPVDDPNVGTAGGPGGGDPSHVGGGLDADEPHVTRMVGCKCARARLAPVWGDRGFVPAVGGVSAAGAPLGRVGLFAEATA